MRVALFTDTFLPKVDGIVTVICRLLEHYQRRGITAMVICPDIGDIDAYAGARVWRTPGVTFPLYPELKASWPLLGTLNELRRFRPHIGHFIHSGFVGGSGMLMLMRLGIPRVASFHIDYARIAAHFGLGWGAPGMNWLTQLMLNRADACLAQSDAIEQRMRDIGIHRPIYRWRRGVDADLFHPDKRTESMRWRLSDGHPDDLLFLTVGRLSSEKRIADLRHVLQAVPGSRLAVIGDGPQRADLRAHFAGLPVHFEGVLTGEMLAQAYASADVFAFPSQTESYGLVVTEAMAAGLPVLASRVGAVPDLVQDGATGLTYAPGDIPGLVRAAQILTADRACLPGMGQAARAFAETQRWDAVMDEVLAVYERVLAKPFVF